MAFRARTIVLLCVLAGVAVLAILHHQPRGVAYAPTETTLPNYSEPTAAQAAATFAQVATPKGFRRRWAKCLKDEACYHSSASVILSHALVNRWLSEAGLTVDRQSAETPCYALAGARTHLALMTCGEISATYGKVELSAFVHAVVRDGPDGIRPTRARRLDGTQGTEIRLIDGGAN